MAKPNVLKELEKEYGDLTVAIPAKVEAHDGNLKSTAVAIGVAHSTLVNFMRDHGYVRVVKWQKKGGNQAQS